MAEAVIAHPDDMRSQALALDAAARRQLRPWYRASVVQDADVSARVLTAWQERLDRPPEPPVGPASRHDLLARLAA